MCARFCDRVFTQLPGANRKNTDDVYNDDVNEGRHARVDRLGELTHPNGTEVSGTDDKAGHIEPMSDIRIAFSIDDKSGRITIKVIDNLTNEVIRHVPPEDLLSVMSWLCEFQDIIAGLVIDEMR